MPILSLGQDAIFVKAPNAVLRIGGFPDFYALLSVPRDAKSAEIDDAVTARAADLLAASFSRGGKGDYIVLLDRHLPDFRPVLLDQSTRASYDDQLRRHEDGDASALPFQTWKENNIHFNRLSRGLKTASKGVKARLRAAFWEAEYF